MPAIDSTAKQRRHISDRNVLTPVKTLCGQKLEKVPYFSEVENFHNSDCQVCRKKFYGEPLNGDQRKEPVAEAPNFGHDGVKSRLLGRSVARII